MKKILFLFSILLIASVSFAQKDSAEVKKPLTKPVNDNPALKAALVERDTSKALLKAKTSAFNKDNTKLTKLHAEKSKLKDQLKAAKHAKKTDKADALQTKVNENEEAIKTLDAQIKEEDKEVSSLEKRLKEAEKEVKYQKEAAAKEKSRK